MARAPEKCETCGEVRPDVCLHPVDQMRICVPCRTKPRDFRQSARPAKPAAAKPSGLVWDGPDGEVLEGPW